MVMDFFPVLFFILSAAAFSAALAASEGVHQKPHWELGSVTVLIHGWYRKRSEISPRIDSYN